MKNNDPARAVVEQLEPCPNIFCGSTAVYLKSFAAEVGHGAVWPDCFAVVCPECRLVGPRDISEAGAMKCWNTRPASPQVGEASKASIVKAMADLYDATKPIGGPTFGQYADAILAALRSASPSTAKGDRCLLLACTQQIAQFVADYDDDRRDEHLMDDHIARFRSLLYDGPTPRPAPVELEERARELWARCMENSDGLAKLACAADIRAGSLDGSPAMQAIIAALSTVPAGEVGSLTLPASNAASDAEATFLSDLRGLIEMGSDPFDLHPYIVEAFAKIDAALAKTRPEIGGTK